MNQSTEVIFALWQANQAVRDLVDDWAEADPERVSVRDFSEEARPSAAAHPAAWVERTCQARLPEHENLSILQTYADGDGRIRKLSFPIFFLDGSFSFFTKFFQRRLPMPRLLQPRHAEDGIGIPRRPGRGQRRARRLRTGGWSSSTRASTTRTPSS